MATLVTLLVVATSSAAPESPEASPRAQAELSQPPQATAPATPIALPPPDRIRLAEVFRLGAELQDRIWPGWSRAPFAVLLVTPEHEFLVRHPHPSDDFIPLGHDSLLQSDVCYRPRTMEVNLLATFPAVGNVSTIVVGSVATTGVQNSTRWVVTLLHEHFHQWQDSQPDAFAAAAALGLAGDDQSGMWMLNYPFPYDDEGTHRAFVTLCRSLKDALDARPSGASSSPGTPAADASPHASARPDSAASSFTSQVAAFRKARQAFERQLSPNDYKYFSFQLWKEGVARYTELRLARLAATQFVPSQAFAALADFVPFADVAQALETGILSQLDQPRLAEKKRSSFYAVGAAEALLLDAINPSWQERYLLEKFFLEKYSPER